MRRARRLAFPALPLFALLFLACTDANGPTPPNSGSPSFGIANQSLTKEERRQRHEELKAQLEAEKRRIHDLREARKAEFELARAEWKTYRRAWKLLHKNKGDAAFDLFRCEPRPYEGDAEIIGPEGGTLHVGEHELVVPKGALVEEQLIVAEAPTSSLVDVEFSPEGLTFAVPARLTLSYKGCEVPLGLDLLLAYVGWGNRILELPPSKDLKDLDEVVGEIEHFSRYAVAY
jgi:hypothetical protein